jgi:Zn-dependent protease with chaperone function
MSLVISFVAPVLLAPLFFRFRPLTDATLRARFERLASAAGVPVIGVFEMAASAKTRRSNAAVVGFGRTRRIVITDTMLAGFSPEEIESVLAHELGHQRSLDPLKGLVVGAIVSVVMLAVAAWAYSLAYAWMGLTTPADLAGLPLLAALSGIVSFVLGPAELAWSRRREAHADRLSLELTRNPAAFASAMVKLHDQNLSVAHPTRWEELLTFTHPSGRERVETARAFAVRAA